MSAPYYCHACQRTVQAEADQALRCSRCHSEFIEEVNIPDEHMQPEGDQGRFQFRVEDFDLFGNLFDSSQAPQNAQNPTAPRQNSQNPTAPRQNSQNPTAPRQNAPGDPSSSRQPQLGQLLNSLLSGFVSPPASSSRTTTTRQQPRGNPQPNNQPNPPEFFNDFLNQLVANLSANAPAGSTFQFQFNAPPIHGDINNYVFGEGTFDQLISHLLNNVNPQQQGLTQEDLDLLKKANIEQDQVDKGIQCTTCIETFKLGEDVIKLDCNHVFHQDCIFPWLSENRTCPICRNEIEPQGKKQPTVITDIDELD